MQGTQTTFTTTTAAELYAMSHAFDSAATIKATVTQSLFLDKPLPLVLCTDSRSLYDCLVKLGTLNEKRLMIDLMCLRQSYDTGLTGPVIPRASPVGPCRNLLTKTNSRSKSTPGSNGQVRIEGWTSHLLFYFVSPC